MKKLTITTLCLAAMTLAGTAQTQPAAPAAREAKPEATSIVFTPRKQLGEDKLAGKLKENVFYWTNASDDAKQGPTVSQDKGKTFLHLKGIGTRTTPKAQTAIRLFRVWNVPAGATTVKLTYEARAIYDEWQDVGGANRYAYNYSFLKDGKEGRKNSPLPGVTLNNEEFQTKSVDIAIPEGAQQLVYTASTDFATTFDLASITAKFGTPAAP